MAQEFAFSIILPHFFSSAKLRAAYYMKEALLVIIATVALTPMETLIVERHYCSGPMNKFIAMLLILLNIFLSD